jgi:hypothetical protein
MSALSQVKALGLDFFAIFVVVVLMLVALGISWVSPQSLGLSPIQVAALGALILCPLFAYSFKKSRNRVFAWLFVFLFVPAIFCTLYAFHVWPF